MATSVRYPRHFNRKLETTASPPDVMRDKSHLLPSPIPSGSLARDRFPYAKLKQGEVNRWIWIARFHSSAFIWHIWTRGGARWGNEDEWAPLSSSFSFFSLNCVSTYFLVIKFHTRIEGIWARERADEAKREIRLIYGCFLRLSPSLSSFLVGEMILIGRGWERITLWLLEVDCCFSSVGLQGIKKSRRTIKWDDFWVVILIFISIRVNGRKNCEIRLHH